jgi:RNA polymerase sigma-70 factor (ECF subfamily)
VKERDAEFTGFFLSAYPALVGTLSLIVHDRETARDIAQEAFIQLFTRWQRVSRYEMPEAWLRRVAIRMAVRAARRERLRPSIESHAERASIAGPVDLDAIRAIARLSPTQRAAVALFYLEDKPVREVAAILGCSTATAKVHLHRARNRLAELLSEPRATLGADDVA